MIRGAIHRYQLAQDLYGHLRLDVLRAAGVTFSEHRASPLKPGEKAPTFEFLMGRPPIDLFGRSPEDVAAVTPEPPGLPDSLKGLTPEERREKAARARANVAAVQARKALKQAAKTVGNGDASSQT